MTPVSVSADFPEKLQFLFEPHSNKVIYGGRNGTKSWGVARALVALGSQRKLRILCARETQQSIRESVHQLIEEQIKALNLSASYTVQQATILGKNGTEFIFAGLRNLSVAQIKSLEGVDILWVEEAAVVSKTSWDTILPTIRKDSAEVWITFNPELSTDDTYKRWVLNPPPSTIVCKTSYRDNNWLSERSKVDIEHMRATDPSGFAHIYEGECKSNIEGAVFGEEIKRATEEGRICQVPYNRTRPVDTAWDLGFGDLNTIWFVQAYDGFYNFIDYHQGSGLTIADYLIVLQNKGYVYGNDWLPHDCVDTIIHRKLSGSTDKTMSIEQMMRQAGRKVRVVPKLFINDRINAARTIFSQCRFDATKCADGIQALRHYQWGPKDEKTGLSKAAPLHNIYSHGADGFQSAAVGIKQPKIDAPANQNRRDYDIEYSPWA